MRASDQCVVLHTHQLDLALLKREDLAIGNTDLPFHKILPSHHFRHRVLHLPAQRAMDEFVLETRQSIEHSVTCKVFEMGHSLEYGRKAKNQT
jgi:hypothetical protein